MRRILRFGVLAGLGFVLGAMTTPSDSAVIGNWDGSLDTGNGSLRLVVHISQAAEGKLTGSMDSPDQGAAGIAIDSLTYKEPDFHFAIAEIGGSFDGKMNHDNSEIAGEWKQSGQSLSLVLKRRSK